MHDIDAWHFISIGLGAWKGFGPRGERTRACRTRQAAEADARAGAWVCPRWPHCDHPTPAACAAAMVAAADTPHREAA